MYALETENSHMMYGAHPSLSQDRLESRTTQEHRHLPGPLLNADGSISLQTCILAQQFWIRIVWPVELSRTSVEVEKLQRGGSLVPRHSRDQALKASMLISNLQERLRGAGMRFIA